MRKEPSGNKPQNPQQTEVEGAVWSKGDGWGVFKVNMGVDGAEVSRKLFCRGQIIGFKAEVTPEGPFGGKVAFFCSTAVCHLHGI